MVLDHFEASCSIGPSVNALTTFQVVLNCLPNAASAQAAAAARMTPCKCKHDDTGKRHGTNQHFMCCSVSLPKP